MPPIMLYMDAYDNFCLETYILGTNCVTPAPALHPLNVFAHILVLLMLI